MQPIILSDRGGNSFIFEKIWEEVINILWDSTPTQRGSFSVHAQNLKNILLEINNIESLEPDGSKLKNVKFPEDPFAQSQKNIL